MDGTGWLEDLKVGVLLAVVAFSRPRCASTIQHRPGSERRRSASPDATLLPAGDRHYIGRDHAQVPRADEAHLLDDLWPSFRCCAGR